MSDEEYEISYTISRRKSDTEEFQEIGFGAVIGADVKQCAHFLNSDLDNYLWETEGDMPDPEEIKQIIEGQR